MANKRFLKKSIHYICSELFAECVAASLYGDGANDETVSALLSAIVSTDADFVGRVSHPEPGMKAKDYYKKLTSDFNKCTGEIIDQIGNLH